MIHCIEKNFNELLYYLKKEKIKTDKDSNKYIYFDCLFKNDAISHIMAKVIIAMGISDKIRGKIIGIMPYEKHCYTLLEGIGGSLDSSYTNPSFGTKIEVTLEMVKLLVICNIKRNLGQIVCRDVLIGDLICNDIVRYNENKYTTKYTDFFKYWMTIKKAVTWLIIYDQKFKKEMPSYYIADEWTYIWGIIARVAAKYGAKIISYSRRISCLTVETIGEKNDFTSQSVFYDTLRKTLLINKNSYSKVRMEAYSSNWIKANTDIIYKNIWKYNESSKEDILKAMGINNNKKNILIMPHCFGDSSYKKNEIEYKDYYEWYIDTLKMVSTLDNVNWIVKPHPLSFNYSENGVAEKLFYKYKSRNMFLWKEKYGADNIPGIADAIITCNGTAGMEFSVYGIPCVNMGNACYSNFGYTINARTKKKYEYILKNMHRIHPLRRQQIEMAQKILYVYKTNVHSIINDKECDIFLKAFHAMAEGQSLFSVDNDFILELCDWLKKNGIQNSYYYQYGYNVTEK